jgi:hypothetical protein
MPSKMVTSGTGETIKLAYTRRGQLNTLCIFWDIPWHVLIFVVYTMTSELQDTGRPDDHKAHLAYARRILR